MTISFNTGWDNSLLMNEVWSLVPCFLNASESGSESHFESISIDSSDMCNGYKAFSIWYTGLVNEVKHFPHPVQK